MQTEKVPRTMKEAFGLYTSHNLAPMEGAPNPYRLRDLILIAVVLGALAMTIVFFLPGLLHP